VNRVVEIYKHPDVVITKNHKAEFTIRNVLGSGVDLLVQLDDVKRTVGAGATDAVRLKGKTITWKHKAIIEVFLSSGKELNYSWTSKEVFRQVKFRQRDSDVEFRDCHYQRELAELSNEALGIIDRPKITRYVVNVEKARKALESGKFD